MAIVYLNGEYLPQEKATISVMDRGFLFGDGVYEVIPVYQNKPFYLQAHLERLQKSLDLIKLQPHFNLQDIANVCHTLIEKNIEDDLYLYIQVTRGVAEKRDHIFPEEIQATLLVMANALPPISEQHLTQGVAAITLEDSRWLHCNIKATTLLANVLARQTAIEVGATEAILIREGYITEGAATNIFLVDAQDQVWTAPANHLILSGITRSVILNILKDLAIPYQESPIPQNILTFAKEVWLTSSTKEILAITKIDDQVVADGKPGVLWHKVWQAFQTLKA